MPTTAPTTVMPGTGPLPDVGCDYTSTMNKSCAIAGCHVGNLPAGDLNLSPDTGLRTRLFNVIAPHADIDCNPNGAFMECVPTTCPTAKLIDSATPDNSWFIKKLDGTQGACGDHMPLPPGDDPTARGWGPPAQACLESLARAIAAGK